MISGSAHGSAHGRWSYSVSRSRFALGTLVWRAGRKASARSPLWASASRLSTKEKEKACGILVPRLEVRPELLWWELRVQTAGLTENLRPQGISIRVRPPRGPHLSTETQLYPTACKLQCWMSQAKQPVRQEYSTTHQKKKWNDKKISYRRRSKVKTYKTK